MTLQENLDILSNLSHVTADMNYLVPMAERPRNYTFEPPAGVSRTNAEHEAHAVKIRDARPIAGHVSLDANGFAQPEPRPNPRSGKNAVAMKLISIT